MDLAQYRTLQLLSNFHNFVFCTPSMVVMAFSCTICESIALCLIITSSSTVPLPVLILFSIVAADLCIVIHAVFKILSYPHVKSLEFIEFVKTRSYSKWEHRFILSCPPSKLSLGDGGFFDKLTSFVIWQKCIDFLITFLLL